MAKQELSQISNEILSRIILSNDLSGLSREQQVQYVIYRSKAAGLDPAGAPFNLIPNKDGKLFLYANKEAAAQLNQIRSLSPVVAKEELLMDGTIYKVTYRVTENGRSTEDCGAVGLVKIKRGVGGQPDEHRRMSPDEMADAIMKAHTKAKRRAILTHCGIGTTDADEPLIVVDKGEEIKPADATVKDTVSDTSATAEEKPVTTEKKSTVPKENTSSADTKKIEKPLLWKGHITDVEILSLPDGKSAWALHGNDGKIFKTADESHTKKGIEANVDYEISYHKNGKGTLVIDTIQAMEAA